MGHMVLGLFTDSEKAGKAVSKLKEKGYTGDISVLAQDKSEDAATLSEVKQDVSDAAATGAATGGAIGGLVGLLAGVSTVTIPGVGIIIGPLASVLGLTGGAATGAIAGGLLAALADLGLSESTAALFNERIQKGEVLVAVATNPGTNDDVRKILTDFQAQEITETKK